MYEIDPTITCFILCIGSLQFAAAFKCADIGPETDPIIYNIESVDINLIGKLVFARLNLPVIICWLIFLILVIENIILILIHLNIFYTSLSHNLLSIICDLVLIFNLLILLV